MLTWINFHRLCRILYTCCDVIVIVNSEKAEVNAVENSNVSWTWRNDNTLASWALPEIAMSLPMFYSIP